MSALWLLAFFGGITATAIAVAEGQWLAAVVFFMATLASGPAWLAALRKTR